MKLYRGHSKYDGIKGGALTIGTFDGFHIGHQRIIQDVVSYSKKKQIPSILFTFDRHPSEFVRPDSSVKRLFSLEYMEEEARSMGLDCLVLEPFSKKFSHLSASLFFEKCIYQIFKPSYLAMGHDFRFGFEGKGSVEQLKLWKKKYGFELKEICPIKIEGEIASSSLLRQAFLSKDFLKIRNLLGRPFSIKGSVESGFGRGKLLGFPTINLQPKVPIFIRGVYIGLLYLDGKTYPSALNIGFCPTFSQVSDQKNNVKVEVHSVSPIEDLGDLKGRSLKVDILKFIRDEKKFKTTEELKKQICSDAEAVRSHFSQTLSL